MIIMTRIHHFNLEFHNRNLNQLLLELRNQDNEEITTSGDWQLS